MGTAKVFKPRSLSERIMWYVFGTSIGVLGSWLIGGEKGWSLVVLAAVFLVVIVPLLEWNYHRQSRMAGGRND